MKRLHYIAYLTCPAMTVLFSLLIGFATMYIQNTISPLFVFLSVQFYLNWYLVYSINKKVIIPFTQNCQEGCDTRFWYCGKCKHYARRPAQHCVLCSKCFYYRDHHCFFLGACILRQNMGNFVLICIYASLACVYSVFTTGPYLYDYFLHSDTSKLNIYYFALNFFFPITLAKFFLVGDESIHVFLVTLFNVSVSIACFTLVYGLWKLIACMSGRQRYYPDYVAKQQDIYEIFGSYGLLNFVFPFNGFLHSRNIDENTYVFTYI
ncbi:palmitoyltransferase ZDHHC22-like [Phymastichus coffea]|uniref:palmitoyltransferase ZDHHC22-like n=1 Tax=Phymastichus coffea TaxID=108790 RepID=UPI00273B764D|nr:palmitoyltransferase ZDHHC22-like [Phymastichus coffea]